jgi:DNA-binding CsgD family transcriptional regulator
MYADERNGKRALRPREMRVIQLVAQGLTNSEVARSVGTTEHVVKNCLRVIYDKLGLWNRVELALWYEARTYRIPPVAQQPSRPSPHVVTPPKRPDALQFPAYDR